MKWIVPNKYDKNITSLSAWKNRKNACISQRRHLIIRNFQSHKTIYIFFYLFTFPLDSHFWCIYFNFSNIDPNFMFSLSFSRCVFFILLFISFISLKFEYSYRFGSVRYAQFCVTFYFPSSCLVPKLACVWIHFSFGTKSEDLQHCMPFQWKKDIEKDVHEAHTHKQTLNMMHFSCAIHLCPWSFKQNYYSVWIGTVEEGKHIYFGIFIIDSWNVRLVYSMLTVTTHCITRIS